MRIEVGTLQEIGAQVGDVVEYTAIGEPEFKPEVFTIAAWVDDIPYSTDQIVGGDESLRTDSSAIFRFISRANQGPVREVTRKEIVPGVYGPLTIRATDELGPVQLEINGTTGRTWFNKSDVESLVNTLTQIRDAMADSGAT